MAKAMKCKNCGMTMKNGKCPKCDAPKGKGAKKSTTKPKTKGGWNDHDYS